jgi:hypothetical protein
LSRLLADAVLPLFAKRLKPVAIGNERSLVTNAGMGQIRRGPAAVVGVAISESSNISKVEDVRERYPAYLRRMAWMG